MALPRISRMPFSATARLAVVSPQRLLSEPAPLIGVSLPPWVWSDMAKASP